MNDERGQILEIYLQEYSKLKDEQIQRIGFRDNLLYVTLGVFGGILAFALGKEANPYALLILPWASLILGWTYLVNDQKISAIGKYIEEELAAKIRRQVSQNNTPINAAEPLFAWEIAHKIDKQRTRRKLEQLLIDELAFVCSGVAGLIAFRYLVSHAHWAIEVLWWLELALLVGLGAEILVYADIGARRKPPTA